MGFDLPTEESELLATTSIYPGNGPGGSPLDAPRTISEDPDLYAMLPGA